MNDEWLARQLLPPRDDVDVAAVVAQAGWIHTAGGTGPYLALAARIRSLHRQDVDQCVFRRFEVVEVPAVRDSTMLVPRADVSVALAAGRRSYDERLKLFAKKCEVTRDELERLGERLLKSIGDGIRSVDQLRAELPPRALRDLGAEGKTLGAATTLPLALRLLQVDGRVLRIPEDHRLDGKLHFYRKWPDSIPLHAVDDLDAELAARFLTWAAPATVDDFATFAGIGKRAAASSWNAGFRPAPPVRKSNEVLLLPFRDNLFHLHRASDESPHYNTIVSGAKLRGIWEYDRDAERIVWRCFETVPRGIEAAIAATGQFIRDELGDHRFYALDSARNRAERIAFIQQA